MPPTSGVKALAEQVSFFFSASLLLRQLLGSVRVDCFLFMIFSAALLVDVGVVDLVMWVYVGVSFFEA